MKSLILAATIASVASVTTAQEVSDCDWQARADALVEPWDEFSRTFANGDVRLALLDTVEPAAGAFHLLILSPPFDEIGARQCRTLGLGGGLGFSGVSFDALEASYDPAVGLIFDLPVAWFDPETADFLSGIAVFTLNQATGQIDAWFD